MKINQGKRVIIVRKNDFCFKVQYAKIMNELRGIIIYKDKYLQDA